VYVLYIVPTAVKHTFGIAIKVARDNPLATVPAVVPKFLTLGLSNSHCVDVALYIKIASPTKSPATKAAPPCFTIVFAPNPLGLKVGVVVVPGNAFFPGLQDEWLHTKQCLRLSLTTSQEDLELGAKLIAQVVEQVYTQA